MPSKSISKWPSGGQMRHWHFWGQRCIQKRHKICYLDFSEILIDDRHSKGSSFHFLGQLWFCPKKSFLEISEYKMTFFTFLVSLLCFSCLIVLVLEPGVHFSLYLFYTNLNLKNIKYQHNQSLRGYLQETGGHV